MKLGQSCCKLACSSSRADQRGRGREQERGDGRLELTHKRECREFERGFGRLRKLIFLGFFL